MSQEANIKVLILKKLGMFILPSHSELGNLQAQWHCAALLSGYIFKEHTRCSDRLIQAMREKEESRMTPRFLVWSMKVVINYGRENMFCGEGQEIPFIQMQKEMPIKYPNSDGDQTIYESGVRGVAHSECPK